jgi:hypothetical protein
VQSCIPVQGISIDKIYYFYGDKSPASSSQNDEYQLDFKQNNTDEINVSRIYFWVQRDPNVRGGHVSFRLRANGDFLAQHSICIYIGGTSERKSLSDGDNLLGPYTVTNNIEKVELVIQKDYRYPMLFPSISLVNVTLDGLNFPDDWQYLSADSDHETIRQYIANAGSTITITEGKNLSFIISKSEGKNLKLLQGTYRGPIDVIGKDNISIEGVPEATIIGIPGNAILVWDDGSNIGISNLIFKDSLGGIFLQDCTLFNISNVQIKNFGVHNALSLKDSIKNRFSNICIYSNEEGTTGILMDRSSDNTISNINIQVKNALYYLKNNSKNNTIYDLNLGEIFDNDEFITENGGNYCINDSCSDTKRSEANNTWTRGDIYPCY